ncbi:hypothetical protein L2E82_36069 [Cichorium intybus]|uniref:Uncharacterized protein n=1 Tax=Cichorium intybus TaxID=13427 RepID=A0ACB9BQM6_CICIN|nr:hypothetical protein L2E82_36069 [Cichorium intybus]
MARFPSNRVEIPRFGSLSLSNQSMEELSLQLPLFQVNGQLSRTSSLLVMTEEIEESPFIIFFVNRYLHLYTQYL